MRTLAPLAPALLLAALATAPLAAQQPAPAGPPAPDAARAQIARLEREWADALLRRDSVALARFIADDYIGVYPTRRYTKRDLLEQAAARPGPGERRLVESRSEPGEIVRVWGDAAVVIGTAYARFADGSGAGSVVRTRYTEVFLWLDGRWQCVSGHYVPLETPI